MGISRSSVIYPGKIPSKLLSPLRVSRYTTKILVQVPVNPCLTLFSVMKLSCGSETQFVALFGVPSPQQGIWIPVAQPADKDMFATAIFVYQRVLRWMVAKSESPVYRWFIPLFIGFQPSKVVQDFFHQQQYDPPKF